MLLVNASAIPAVATIHPAEGGRALLATAKATFSFEGTLERAEPEPLRDTDEETPIGLLPSDAIGRLDNAFEVVCLGNAYAAGGRPTTQQSVALSVGTETRRLVVTGDRRWKGRRPTPPVPWTMMPLTWDRAFGGACDVYLDAESPLEVTHPLNRRGRGFDPKPYADGLRQLLRLPDGLPYYRFERWLPNVEAPDAMVTSPADTPEPAGWGAVPRDIGLSQLPSIRGEATGDEALAMRAHPDWVIDRPTPSAPVVLDGMTPEGRVELALPTLRIFVDIATGSVELRPQLLVLLPEERRFYLVYRGAIEAPTPCRRGRLRVEEGAAA